MLINGKEYTLSKPTNLQELIKELGYKEELIAIELNEQLVPKNKFHCTYITAVDKLEIVSFVGGG